MLNTPPVVLMPVTVVLMRPDVLLADSKYAEKLRKDSIVGRHDRVQVGEGGGGGEG